MSVAENHRGSRLIDYFMLLAIAENTLLAWEPTRRIVPTTITRITASITRILRCLGPGHPIIVF